MTTLATLSTAVSRDLRDVGGLTFDATARKDLINEALTELGRIVPLRFVEDLQPVAGQLDYQLRKVGSDQPLTTPFGAASTNLLTSASHGLTAGTAIRFTVLTGGTGLAVGVVYYVLATGLTTDAFRVAPIVSGTQVDFTTDITEGTFNRVGVDDAIPEIEVKRVEVWDLSVSPAAFRYLLTPGSEGYVRTSRAGWEVWGGILSLTKYQADIVRAGTDVIRVQGYSPYTPLVNDNDIVGVSNEVEQAMRVYCQVAALRRLGMERDLFAQWQTRSENSDISPAGLMSMYAAATDDWRRRERKLLVLREAF